MPLRRFAPTATGQTAEMARKRYNQLQRRQMEEVWLAIISCDAEGWAPAFQHGGILYKAYVSQDLKFSSSVECKASFGTINDWARSIVAKKRGSPKNETYLSLRSKLRFIEDGYDVPPEDEWLTIDKVLNRINREWAEVIFASVFVEISLF